MNKVYLTWDDISNAVNQLALNIKSSNIEISAIKGLQRGGLIPAVMLSHLLDIPMTNNEVVSSDVLIVDDICDTGNTLKEYRQLNHPIATIHYKPSALVEPNFWCILANEGEWIVYPWERKDSETIQNYLKQ
jgi:hypoxanthine phosphoribosyltransferase